VDGRVIDLDGIMRLSKLPSEEELLAKLLMTLNAPITGFVTVLGGVLRNFMGVLEAIKCQKEEG
jgi:large subunit ribosomal protein L10